MKKTILYFLLGTLSSFVFNHWIMNASDSWKIDLFYSIAFGCSWGLAYYVDRPDWVLSKKMGISFVGIAIILAFGLMFFNLETALPSVVRFSTVFVAYYLFASFRETKSLRK